MEAAGSTRIHRILTGSVNIGGVAERKRLQPRVSDEARRGWQRAVEANATDLSALMEALGRALDDGTFRVPEEVAVMARRIEAERRRRD